MFKQKNKNPSNEAETIIGPSVMVKGNLNSSGNIIIEGVLKGEVKTAGELYVGNKAEITANIEAKTARIGGEIRGNIKIEDFLQLSTTAKVFGDINCTSIAIERGAIVNGNVLMSKTTTIAEKKEVEKEKV